MQIIEEASGVTIVIPKEDMPLANADFDKAVTALMWLYCCPGYSLADVTDWDGVDKEEYEARARYFRKHMWD